MPTLWILVLGLVLAGRAVPGVDVAGTATLQNHPSSDLDSTAPGFYCSASFHDPA